MSNFLAIATVTAALQRLLQSAVEVDVAGARATLDRPDSKPTGPVVNVFMYEALPNPVMRNDDLPVRRPDGSVAQRPRAALDLHYLLTFHGDDNELEPQRLFGSVVRTLHARPLVTRALVDAVVAAAGAQPAAHASLADSNLAGADEMARLAPLPLDVEAMSRLWAVFPQTAYVLSSTWSASCVVIEADEIPELSAPVATSVLSVAPLRRPRIEKVEVAGDATGPLTAGTTWRIVGSQLSGDGTEVRVAGQPVVPTSGSQSDLRFDMPPPATLRAGRVAVEVVHRAMLGDPPEPRGETGSDLLVVGLRPRVLSASAAAGSVSVTLDIPVRTRQRVAVRLLQPPTGEPVAVVPLATAEEDTDTVAALVPAVTAGQYAVVVSVDGADSPVQRDGSGAVTAPLVTLS